MDSELPAATFAIGCVLTFGALTLTSSNSFNNAAAEVQDRTMQVSADTTYTKDGEIADIKRDTTYILTKADFDKISP